MNIIDLGNLGDLVSPVQVEGKTYMVLTTTKGKKHTWEDRISMVELQRKFFGGEKVTEENNICEVNGHKLRLPTKDEMLAIRQHFNGTPSGWDTYSNYWSATPSGSGHAYVSLAGGVVYDYDGNFSYYVAFEVL